MGGALWAGTLEGNLYRGETGLGDWRFAMRGRDTNAYLTSPAFVTGMAQFGSSLYVGFGYRQAGYPEACGGCADPADIGGIYRSSDGGATWSKLPLKGINALSADQNGLYAATPEGIFQSTDGDAWTPFVLSPAGDYQATNACRVNFCLSPVRQMRRAQNEFFLWVGNQVQRWTLSGKTLTHKGDSVPAARGLAVIGNHVLVASDSGLFHALPGIARWDTLRGPPLSAIIEDSGRALAAPAGGQAFLYAISPDGKTRSALPLAGNASVMPACRHRGRIFGLGGAGPAPWDRHGPVFALDPSAPPDQISWSSCSRGVYGVPAAFLAAAGEEVWVAKWRARTGTGTYLRRATSSGWDSASPPMTALAASGGRLLGGSANALWTRSASGWERLDSSLAMINSVVDIAPGPDWAAAYEEERGTLMVCEDLGSAHPHCSLTTPSVPMRVPGTGIGYLYRGTPASPDLTKRLAAVGGLLAFARKDIYLSPDHGRTWTDMGPPAGLTPIVIRPFQGRFYVAGVDSAAAPPVPWVALSPDSGRTWSRLGRALPGTRSSWTLAFRPGEIYAGTDSGVFRWKEGGAAWEALNDGLIDREVCDLALSGDRLVAGMASGSVWEMDLEPDGVRPDRTARAGAPKPRVPGIFPDGAGGWRRLDGSALRSRNRPGSRHGS